MEPGKKSEVVRRLVASGEYKAALSIAKGFRIGISSEDSKAMTRGFECIVHPGFYSQIGINEADAVKKAIDTVKRLYGTERGKENEQSLSGLHEYESDVHQ